MNSSNTSKGQKRSRQTNNNSQNTAISAVPTIHRFENIPHLLINKYYQNDYRLLGKLSTLTMAFDHSAKIAQRNLIRKLTNFIIDSLTINCNDIIQSTIFLEVSQNIGRILNAFVIILDTPDEFLRISVSFEPSATPLWYYMFHVYPTKITTFLSEKNNKQAQHYNEPSITLKYKHNDHETLTPIKQFIENYFERNKIHKVSFQCILEFVASETDCVMNYQLDNEGQPIYLNGLDIFNHTDDWKDNIIETQAGILDMFDEFEPVKFINMETLEKIIENIFLGNYNHLNNYQILQDKGLTVVQNSILKHRYEYLTGGKYYKNISPFIKPQRNGNALNLKSNVKDFNNTNVSKKFSQTSIFIITALTKYVNDVVQSSMFLNISHNNPHILSVIKLEIEAMAVPRSDLLTMEFLVFPHVNFLWAYMFPVFTEFIIHENDHISLHKSNNSHYAIKNFMKKIHDFLHNHSSQKINFTATFLLDAEVKPNIDYEMDQFGNPININGVERYAEKYWLLSDIKYSRGGNQIIALKEFNQAMKDVYNERHLNKDVWDILDEYGLNVGKNSLIKYRFDKYSNGDYMGRYFRAAGAADGANSVGGRGAKKNI
jgi:hypothetical protein